MSALADQLRALIADQFMVRHDAGDWLIATQAAIDRIEELERRVGNDSRRGSVACTRCGGSGIEPEN